MKIIVYIWAVVAVVLLLAGAKVFGRKKWNDEVMSLDHTKSFLGWAAFVILLHHCSHMTIASWVNPYFQRPGLEMFVSVGYLMVAVFFFCSGYGLYKSAKAKPGFFKRFIPARMIPILIPTAITFAFYIAFRYIRKIPFDIDSPFEVNAHSTWHPYIWYIPCTLLLYLLFYIGFGLFKKDWIGILVVALGSVGYWIYCWKMGFGSWWFNTLHLFLCGIIFAKFEKKLIEHMKKLYILRLIVLFVLQHALYYIGENSWGIMMDMKLNVFEYDMTLIQCIFQMLSAFFFVALCLTIGLKLKVGNPVLRFFGKMTLELYLIHGMFVHLFAYYIIKEGVKPVCYIDNVALYVLVVVVLSIPVSYAVSLLDKKVGKMLKPKK